MHRDLASFIAAGADEICILNNEEQLIQTCHQGTCTHTRDRKNVQEEIGCISGSFDFEEDD